MPPKPGQRRSRRGISPLYTIRPGPQPPYRYFRALPRTRLSNTPLRIAVCAVWNGFTIVCASQQRPAHSQHTPTLTYSSHTSIRNARIPSSFLPSCSSTNFMSAHRHHHVAQKPYFLLPGVMNADTVHSLNLSTDFRYLPHRHCTPGPQHASRTSYFPCALHPQSHPAPHSQSSGSHGGPAHHLPAQSLHLWSVSRSMPPTVP